ncbi:D-malate degradation protein R [Serratia fonticola]|uniref:D-malate degradation protein R n=1 Tax=Serratia fonticola TaxID=47917 RepID=A0A4U9UA52_SERFO|nr:D-malate degradation protein R [Serratia fonticola]
MKRNLNDLLYFVTVARESSFTRAAAQLGVTQPALSQAISALEERMQIRLLTRTTRSVSPTSAGERLLLAIGNRIDEIEAELDMLTELRDKPAGTVRITCGPNVLHSTLLPKLTPLLHEYPDINIEFDANHGFRDIVADRFDAGVRLGDTIDKDMIAVPIGPNLRMAAQWHLRVIFHVILYPTPPMELTQHRCINQTVWSGLGACISGILIRMRGILMFASADSSFSIPLNILLLRRLQDTGLLFLPEEEFGTHIKEGNLVRVLEQWCKPFPGYYLYYPSRKQPSPAFSLVLEALRIGRKRKPANERLEV